MSASASGGTSSTCRSNFNGTVTRTPAPTTASYWSAFLDATIDRLLRTISYGGGRWIAGGSNYRTRASLRSSVTFWNGRGATAGRYWTKSRGSRCHGVRGLTRGVSGAGRQDLAPKGGRGCARRRTNGSYRGDYSGGGASRRGGDKVATRTGAELDAKGDDADVGVAESGSRPSCAKGRFGSTAVTGRRARRAFPASGSADVGDSVYAVESSCYSFVLLASGRGSTASTRGDRVLSS